MSKQQNVTYTAPDGETYPAAIITFVFETVAHLAVANSDGTTSFTPNVQRNDDGTPHSWRFAEAAPVAKPEPVTPEPITEAPA